MRFSEPAAVHIAVSMRHWFARTVIADCGRYRRRLGIYPESPHPEGLRRPLKWMLYTALRFLRCAGVDFVIPLGQLGVAWYRACGYRRVCPCAFAADFVAEPVLDAPTAGPEGTFQILFLGRCIALKRVDCLLDALARQRSRAWRCTIAGDGPEKAGWQARAERLGLSDRVQFCPSMPFRDALALIRASDLLVLPSAHEGWGVVINEALMSGVPAICSDGCAAADLLQETWRGTVFRNGSVRSLAEVLDAWISKGRVSLDHRRRIQQWSQCVHGPALAQYVLAVVVHVYQGGPRPDPPWLRRSRRTPRGDHDCASGRGKPDRAERAPDAGNADDESGIYRRIRDHCAVGRRAAFGLWMRKTGQPHCRGAPGSKRHRAPVRRARVAFVQLDVLSAGNHLRREVLARLEGRLRDEELFLVASHTHYAPDARRAARRNRRGRRELFFPGC